MNKNYGIVIILLLSILVVSGCEYKSSATNSTEAIKWTVDPVHSSLHYGIAHKGVSNSIGQFTGFKGTYEEAGANSNIEASVDVSSIDSANKKRDGHLLSKDFFNAAKFPKMTFQSTSIHRKGNHATITGTFTLLGVSKEITIEGDFSDPYSTPKGTSCGFSGKCMLNRNDFGMSWNKELEPGRTAIGTQVMIFLELELAQAK